MLCDKRTLILTLTLALITLSGTAMNASERIEGADAADQVDGDHQDLYRPEEEAERDEMVIESDDERVMTRR